MKDQRFKSGLKNKEEIQNNFFRELRLTDEGEIEFQDFLAFYRDISVGILSDEIFAKRIFETWNVSESQNSGLTVAELRFLSRTFKDKLINKSVDLIDEYYLRKVFREIDLEKNGTLCLDKFNNLLVKLEIPMEHKYLTGIFNYLDKEKNGKVEFEELVKFIVIEHV